MKERISSTIGCPLFMVMRDVAVTGSRIEAVVAWLNNEPGNVGVIRRRWSHKYDITDAVIARLLRDTRMSIERFQKTCHALDRRYGSRRRFYMDYMRGALFVELVNGWPRAVRVCRVATGEVVDTSEVRRKSLEKNKRKPIAEQEALCLVDELDYIAKLQKREELSWNRN